MRLKVSRGINSKQPSGLGRIEGWGLWADSRQELTRAYRDYEDYVFWQTTLVGSKVVDFGKQFEGSQQKYCDRKITAILARIAKNQQQGVVVKLNTDLNSGWTEHSTDWIEAIIWNSALGADCVLALY